MQKIYFLFKQCVYEILKKSGLQNIESKKNDTLIVITLSNIEIVLKR